MREVAIGSVIVRIYPETRTVSHHFPDGTTLHASPEANDAYRDRAVELGYDDPWEMCVDHELGHQYLAWLDGNEWSWVLWDVAHGTHHTDPVVVGREESLVLSWQRQLRKPGPRPWDQR